MYYLVMYNFIFRVRLDVIIKKYPFLINFFKKYFTKVKVILCLDTLFKSTYLKDIIVWIQKYKSTFIIIKLLKRTFNHKRVY